MNTNPESDPESRQEAHNAEVAFELMFVILPPSAPLSNLYLFFVTRELTARNKRFAIAVPLNATAKPSTVPAEYWGFIRDMILAKHLEGSMEHVWLVTGDAFIRYASYVDAYKRHGCDLATDTVVAAADHKSVTFDYQSFTIIGQ
jgi:hypothetical protein